MVVWGSVWIEFQMQYQNFILINLNKTFWALGLKDRKCAIHFFFYLLWSPNYFIQPSRFAHSVQEHTLHVKKITCIESYGNDLNHVRYSKRNTRTTQKPQTHSTNHYQFLFPNLQQEIFILLLNETFIKSSN